MVRAEALATNLDVGQAPAEAFAGLYHQRWRIEEAFKRLKHRRHLRICRPSRV